MFRLDSWWPVPVLASLLAGCTIAAMSDQNKLLEASIQQNEVELRQAENANRRLQAERASLESDLRNRELTIAEIKTRLEAMKRLNASSAATPAQTQQRAAREKQIDDSLNQVRAAERDTSASQEAKARRLQELKRELRKTLELMAST